MTIDEAQQRLIGSGWVVYERERRAGLDHVDGLWFVARRSVGSARPLSLVQIEVLASSPERIVALCDSWNGRIGADEQAVAA